MLRFVKTILIKEQCFSVRPSECHNPWVIRRKKRSVNVNKTG